MFEILLFLLSVFAGFLGAILGIGGGLIIVPALTLLLGVDIKYAIAASLISIIATSSGAAASFLRDHMTNLRVAVFLEIGTVFGAITGFLIATYIQSSMLYFLFGVFLIFSAVMMLRQREENISQNDHPVSAKLKFASHFPGPDKQPIHYKVEGVWLGLFLMYGAGILSALLGIGSGVLKVLAMDGAMKLPMKVSSATSNFMIGVTAVASASAYMLRGDVHPPIVVPVAIGIILGSWVGARTMMKMSSGSIRKIFIALLIIVSIQMIYKGMQG